MLRVGGETEYIPGIQRFGSQRDRKKKHLPMPGTTMGSGNSAHTDRMPCPWNVR